MIGLEVEAAAAARLQLRDATTTIHSTSLQHQGAGRPLTSRLQHFAPVIRSWSAATDRTLILDHLRPGSGFTCWAAEPARAVHEPGPRSGAYDRFETVASPRRPPRQRSRLPRYIEDELPTHELVAKRSSRSSATTRPSRARRFESRPPHDLLASDKLPATSDCRRSTPPTIAS